MLHKFHKSDSSKLSDAGISNFFISEGGRANPESTFSGYVLGVGFCLETASYLDFMGGTSRDLCLGKSRMFQGLNLDLHAQNRILTLPEN